MKAIVLAVGLFGAGSACAAAPFCVFYGGGALCNYYDMQSCQSAAKTFQGMCAPNQQAQQQPAVTAPAPAPQAAQLPQLELPNFYETWSRARNEGAARRQRKDEYKARMAQAPAATYVEVRYLCPDGNGNTFETYRATVGCLVLEVTPVR